MNVKILISISIFYTTTVCDLVALREKTHVISHITNIQYLYFVTNTVNTHNVAIHKIARTGMEGGVGFEPMRVPLY